MNQKTLSAIRKAAASLVTAVLLITAPGLPCYQAAAQTNFRGTVGISLNNIGISALPVNAVTGMPNSSRLDTVLPDNITGMSLTGTSLKIQEPSVAAKMLAGDAIFSPLPNSAMGSIQSNNVPVNDGLSASKSLIKAMRKTGIRFSEKEGKKGAPVIDFDGIGAKDSLVADEAVDALGRQTNLKMSVSKRGILSQPTES